MTTIMINAERGPDFGRVDRLVIDGVTASMAEAREVTAMDIHQYILQQERRMDMDIVRTIEAFQTGINRNGFDIKIVDVLDGLELSNASWFRKQVVTTEGRYDEAFTINEDCSNLLHATAQITPTDFLTWLGNTPDPIRYLRDHVRRTVQHNVEFEMVSEAAAKFAEERQFCNEYDRIVESLAANFSITNCPMFGQRAKTYNLMMGVTVYVPLQVTAPNEDVARDIAADQIRSESVLDMYRNGNYEITSSELND